MDRTAAERLVQATLQKQVSSTIQSSGSAGASSTSLGRGSASTSQSSASDSSSGLPLPKTIAQSSQTETNLSLKSEEDNALESAAASFWDFTNNATDDTIFEGFFDQMVGYARAFKGGRIEGSMGTELLGALDGEGSFNELAEAINRVDKLGLSASGARMNDQLSEEGLGFWDKMAIMGSNKAAGLEIVARSLGQMFGSGTEASTLGAMAAVGTATGAAYAAVGAAAGTAATPVGTAVGGGAGFLTGFTKGAIGSLSGMVDAQATILEIAKEELAKRGLPTTGDNLKEIFNDDQITERMRNKAIARGVTIAIFDALTVAGAGKAVGLAAKTGRVTSSAGKQALSMGLEGVGASTGEAVAQLVSDGEIDAFEAVLEGVAELPMGSLTLAASTVPTYKVNGQKVSQADIESMIRSGEILDGVDIKRDPELQARVDEAKKAQKPSADEVRTFLEKEARRSGVQLVGTAFESAFRFSYSTVKESLDSGDEEGAKRIVRQAINNSRVKFGSQVSELNISDLSTSSRAEALAESRYSKEGNEASELRARAGVIRSKIDQATTPQERKNLEQQAIRLENEAKAKQSERADYYSKLVIANPVKAEELQRLDIEINQLEGQLKDPNLEEDLKAALKEDLVKKAKERVAIESSLEKDIKLDPVQRTTGMSEDATVEVDKLTQKEADLNARLNETRKQLAEGTASPEDVADIEAEIAAVNDEKAILQDAIKIYADARSEYEGNKSDENAQKVRDAADSIAGVLGIETAQEADTRSASLDGIEGVREATAAEYATAMAKAFEVAKERDDKKFLQVTQINEQEAQAILDGGGKLFISEDGMAGAYVKADGYMGGLFKSPDSSQKGVSGLMQKARARYGGKYFDAYGTELEAIYIKNGYKPVARIKFNPEYAPDGWDADNSPLKDQPDLVFFTKGEGKAGDGPMVETYEDGMAATEKVLAESEGKKDSSEEFSFDDIDQAHADNPPKKSEVKAEVDQKLPEGVVQTPRGKDGKSAWKEGDAGLTVEEAGVLNRFQKLADFLGIKIALYPNPDAANALDNGKHGATWGGLYTPGTRTIHINPSQIRQNQSLEFSAGLKKTKSFKATVQEEVMHAVIGNAISKLYLTNPDAAKAFKENLKKIAGRNPELLARLEAQEQSYKNSGKPEHEVFEEGVIELLSAFASDSTEMSIIDRIRVAINKMMLTMGGGKEFAISSNDSMQSIIAKFSLAQDQGVTFGSNIKADDTISTDMASAMVSPAKLKKNEDGSVTVNFQKTIYKHYGFGEGKKDIGGFAKSKTFRDQWHFINWWKKVTDMGVDQDLYGFTDVDGNRIDVDRIKTYGARKSGLLSPGGIKGTALEINKMVAAAESQGLISSVVAKRVRAKTGPILRQIQRAEERGMAQPSRFDKSPGFQEKVDGFKSHVEGLIKREAEAQGKEFKFGGNPESRASDILFSFLADKGSLTPAMIERIGESLEKMGMKKPKGKAETYEALRQFLTTHFAQDMRMDDGSRVNLETGEVMSLSESGMMFVHLLGSYIDGSPESQALLVEKFGNENPIDFFDNYNTEGEAKVKEAIESGVLTGSLKDNMAKLNTFVALLSAKNTSKPNVEAALALLKASEMEKANTPMGISTQLSKLVSKDKIPGASGIAKRSYVIAINKLNELINGNLDSRKGIPKAVKTALQKEVNKNGPFVDEEGGVDWNRLLGFLVSEYKGDRVKVKGQTMGQKIFGQKVGAWMLNMNQKTFPGVASPEGVGLADVITVDTHVLNTAALVDGSFFSAHGKYLYGAISLANALDIDIFEDGTKGKNELATTFQWTDAAVIKHANSIASLPGFDFGSMDSVQKKVVDRAIEIAKDLDSKAREKLKSLPPGDPQIDTIERALERMQNPAVSESSVVKRQAADFVAKATQQLNEKYGLNLTNSQVGQLIFADRQIFLGASDQTMFDESGALKPSDPYKTYGAGLKSLPPITRGDVDRTSQLVMFPTEAGKQDATESSLFRKRKADTELKVLKSGERLTNRVVDEALSTDATSRRIIGKNVEVKEGQKVGIRLNLNVMKNTGVPVQTLHDKTATGEALKYAGAVMVKNPNLNVNQNARKKIVTFQENKFPMASVDGEFLTGNIDDMNFDGVKAFFNPFKHNVFVDAAGRPIKSAEEATIVGNTVYLRGDIEYYGYNDPILEQGRKETAEERAKRVKRGPKYTKALKRFKMMAERNGIEFLNDVELEAAYDNMPIESKVALNESEVAARMEEAQSRASNLLKIRKTAGRMARKYPGQRGDIINNPKNYFTPQSLKEVKGNLEEKTDAELISMMSGQGLASLQSRNDDMGVLATSELINRAVARGDGDAVPFLVEQAAAMGTTAGRLLRHLRELKSSSPAGIVSIIESAVAKRGNRLSDSQKQRLERMASDLFRYQAEHEALMKRAIAGEDVEIELEAATRRVKMTERELDTFSNGVVERGWGEIGTMLIQGNLLTPMSQITNVGANMINALGKVAVDAIALPVERLINMFGIDSPMKRNYSINAYMYGLRKFGQGFVEALDTIATGQEADVTEWRVHRGFAPFRSLMSAMGKGDLPLGPDGTVSNMQRMKLAVQGTLGIPAETMFRFLTLGDTPFRRYVEGIELYQAGRAQGLEGDALKNFIKHPTKKQREAAEREGRKLTFQERTNMSDMAEDAIGFMERMISKGMSWVPGMDSKAFAKFLVRSNMPYVRTPANMLIETLTYVSPYVAGPSILKKLSHGDARGAAQDFGKIAVGTMVSQTAVALIREGLISEALDWSDDEKRNISYDQFPPSSINVTGVQRWVRGEDPSHQPDDVFVGYNKLGILGAVIGATAKSVDRAELRQREDEDMATHALQDVFGLGAFSGITYMMDQSFMQGMSTLIDVISASDAEDLGAGFEKWVKTTFSAVSATALPNTLSALYRGDREYLPDTRVTKDMSRGERILTQMAYTIKDRTFGLGDLPVRVDWKGNPIKQNPRGTTGIAYQIFDITKSRQGEADAVSNEIYRLYEQTEDLTKACGTPGYASKRKINVPNITSRYKKKLQQAGINYPWMQDEEFQAEAFYLNTTQLNKLMEASGKERYQELEALINTEEYARMGDEERVRAMNKINDNYNGAIEYDGNRFRNHTLMLFQIMQEVYENERAED